MGLLVLTPLQLQGVDQPQQAQRCGHSKYCCTTFWARNESLIHFVHHKEQSSPTFASACTRGVRGGGGGGGDPNHPEAVGRSPKKNQICKTFHVQPNSLRTAKPHHPSPNPHTVVSKNFSSAQNRKKFRKSHDFGVKNGWIKVPDTPSPPKAVPGYAGAEEFKIGKFIGGSYATRKPRGGGGDYNRS